MYHSVLSKKVSKHNWQTGCLLICFIVGHLLRTLNTVQFLWLPKGVTLSPKYKSTKHVLYHKNDTVWKKTILIYCKSHTLEMSIGRCLHAPREIAAYKLSLTHTHTHARTHTHWVSMFYGYIPNRRNDFYTVQSVFLFPTLKYTPLPKCSAFLDFLNRSFCMIYKLLSSWEPKTSPQGHNLLVFLSLWGYLVPGTLHTHARTHAHLPNHTH